MFFRHLSRLRVPHSQFRKGSFLLFSSLSAASLPTYLILNSESLPSPSAPHQQPLKALIRSYIVYSLCMIPALVDNSPKLLDTLAKVPGLKHLTYGLVKVTFFDQFVGGETASATLPLLRALRAANKGALFSYSVEVDENEALGSSATANSELNGGSELAPHKRIAREILNCIDVAADFEDSLRGASKALPPYLLSESISPNLLSSTVSDKGRRTWVAIKLTAMLPNAHALINFSKYITSARETMKRGVHMAEAGSGLTARLDYERLYDLSRGEETFPIEEIPFPGCPVPGDMDIILPQIRLPPQGPEQNSSTLTVQDIHDLNELYSDLLKICTHAQERGVKVVFDAEYSWYQPALDALIHSLMREFNTLLPSPPTSTSPSRVQPLVYSTYQAYLRRTPLHLAYSLQDARQNNYALGVKLVRGAYHPHEISAHSSKSDDSTKGGYSLSISPDFLPPVWQTKADTDKAYNECVRLVIAAVKDDVDQEAGVSSFKDQLPLRVADAKPWVPDIFGWLQRPTSIPVPSRTVLPDSEDRSRQGQIGVGVLFGTHNWDSCNIILDQLIKVGLGKIVTTKDGETEKKVEKVELSEAVTERVAIGQLYGMCDDLTDSIVSRTLSSSPLAIKYVPYGALSEVLPYLGRRAIENKSMLNDGGAIKERRRAGKEIWKKVTGWARFSDP